MSAIAASKKAARVERLVIVMTPWSNVGAGLRAERQALYDGAAIVASCSGWMHLVGCSLQPGCNPGWASSPRPNPGCTRATNTPFSADFPQHLYNHWRIN